MAYTRVLHDKKQDLAHIADILLFHIFFSCFDILAANGLRLMVHHLFGLAENSHAGTDSRFADGLCSCLYEYMLLFCMRKKAGRADFLHEKADADREGA